MHILLTNSLKYDIILVDTHHLLDEITLVVLDACYMKLGKNIEKTLIIKNLNASKSYVQQTVSLMQNLGYNIDFTETIFIDINKSGRWDDCREMV